MNSMEAPRRRIAFARINERAMLHCDELLHRWLPGGRRVGHDYMVSNPKRKDSTPSLSVSTQSGAWLDFGSDARGGDLISLAAYLFDLSQAEAAHRVAEMVGADCYE